MSAAHSMEEAEVLCDRLGIFVDGSLQCIGNPKEVSQISVTIFCVEQHKVLPTLVSYFIGLREHLRDYIENNLKPF